MDKVTKNELLNKIDFPDDYYVTLVNIDSEPILRAVVESKTNLEKFYHWLRHIRKMKMTFLKL